MCLGADNHGPIMLVRARRRRKTYPKRLAARLYLQAREAGVDPQEAARIANAKLKSNKQAR